MDDFENESHVILRKMIYNVNEQVQLISDYISLIIESSINAIKYFQGYGGIPEGWASIAAMEAVNILFDLMLSFKNPVFSEEKEWRLIKGREKDLKPEQLKFRETKEGIIIPYLETYIVQDFNGEQIFPISAIKFGPTLDETRTKGTIDLFLRKESNSNKIKIDVATLDVSGAGYVLRR